MTTFLIAALTWFVLAAALLRVLNANFATYRPRPGGTR